MERVTEKIKQHFHSTGFRLIVVFLLSILVRAVFFSQIQQVPTINDLPIDMDSYLYDQRAQEIVNGVIIGDNSESHPLYVNPLYPYFLAAIFKLCGHSLDAVRWIQYLFGACGACLIYWIARIQFNGFIALLAGLLAAVYNAFYFLESFLLISSLTLILMEVFLLLILIAERDKKIIHWTAAGFVLALSILTYAQAHLLVPVVIMYLFLTHRPQNATLWDRIKQAVKPVAWFTVGLLIILGPNKIISTIHHTDFALVGIHYYIGNWEKADGMLTPPLQISPNPRGHADEAQQIAERESRKKLTPAQVSYFWINKSITYLRHQPWSYMKLQFKKLLLFWSGYEIPNNENMKFYRPYSFLLGVPFFSYGWIAPLGLLGFCLALRKKITILHVYLLSIMVAVVLFFITARYRLPVAISLIIFAAYTIHWFYLAWQDKNYRAFLFAFVILAASIAANQFNIPTRRMHQDLATDYYKLGVFYAKESHVDSATAAYTKCIAIDPQCSMAYNNLGNIFKKRGEVEEAEKNYRQAIHTDPLNYRAFNNLGILLVEQNKLNEAEAQFTKAIGLNPGYEIALKNLRIVRGKLSAEAAKQSVN
jgi:tetratricopeptide (TPR) repeat protein